LWIPHYSVAGEVPVDEFAFEALAIWVREHARTVPLAIPIAARIPGTVTPVTHTEAKRTLHEFTLLPQGANCIVRVLA
jgi:hypothetical protein